MTQKRNSPLNVPIWNSAQEYNQAHAIGTARFPVSLCTIRSADEKSWLDFRSVFLRTKVLLFQGGTDSSRLAWRMGP